MKRNEIRRERIIHGFKIHITQAHQNGVEMFPKFLEIRGSPFSLKAEREVEPVPVINTTVKLKVI
jgi:hypothetical protein